MISVRLVTFLACCLFLCPLPAVGQQKPCTLKLAELPQVPELRGFYLGMTGEQFRARAPKMPFKRADELGTTAVNIFPAFEPNVDPASFTDIKTISLEFLDNRLAMLWVGYDTTFKWQTLDECAAGIGAVLRLPDAWQAEARARQMECEDFQVRVAMIGQTPSVRLTDKTARQTLEKRRAAKEAAEP